MKKMRHPFRTPGISMTLAVPLIFSVGCSSADDDEQEVRSPTKVESEVGSLSSKTLNILAIKGKVVDLGPLASSCDSGESSMLWVRHPWSIYGAGIQELRKGMENLERKLPGRGWEIEKSGKDDSMNKNQEIHAIHLKTRTQLEAVLLKGSNQNDPVLEVTLISQCFKKPDS